MINGVLDEKGNYIYLSQDEINKLCLEIQTNGEVDTHEDFVNICNKIISLSINEAVRLVCFFIDKTIYFFIIIFIST